MTGCSVKLLFLFILLPVPMLLFGGFRCDDDVTTDVISDLVAMFTPVATAKPGRWRVIAVSRFRPRLISLDDFRPQSSSARLGSDSARWWAATQCSRSSGIPAVVSLSVSVVSSTNQRTLGIGCADGGIAAAVGLIVGFTTSSPPLHLLNAILSPTCNAWHFAFFNNLDRLKLTTLLSSLYKLNNIKTSNALTQYFYRDLTLILHNLQNLNSSFILPQCHVHGVAYFVKIRQNLFMR